MHRGFNPLALTRMTCYFLTNPTHKYCSSWYFPPPLITVVYCLSHGKNCGILKPPPYWARRQSPGYARPSVLICFSVFSALSHFQLSSVCLMVTIINAVYFYCVFWIVHDSAHVDSVTRLYNLVPVKVWYCSAAGKVTVACRKDACLCTGLWEVIYSVTNT